MVDAHQHVGDGRLQPGDGQRLAGDAAGAGQLAAHDHGARRQLLRAGHDQPALRRQHRRDLQLDLAAAGLLPQEAVVLRRGLRELDEAGAHLVRAGRGGSAQRQRRGECLHEMRRITAHPAHRSAAGCGPGLSMRTEYLASRRSYSACSSALRRSARTSRSTSGRTAASSAGAPSLRSRTSTRCRPKLDSTGPLHCPGGSFISASANSCPKARATSRTGSSGVSAGSIEASPRFCVDTSGPASRSLASSFDASAASDRATPIRPQQHLAERELRFGAEGLGMPLQPGRQLGVGGRRGSRIVDEQELELLAQAPLDDDVVAFQAHGDGFARGDLFLHVLVDQALQLERVGRALPGAGEGRGQVLDHAARDDDAAGAGTATALPCRPQEQQRPQQHKVKQRFAQESFQHGGKWWNCAPVERAGRTGSIVRTCRPSSARGSHPSTGSWFPARAAT